MKIFIIALNKKIMLLIILLLIFATACVLFANAIYNKNIKASNNVTNENNELDDNYKLNKILDSLMSQGQKIIYEEDDRIIFKNTHYVHPSPLPTYKLSKVIEQGIEVPFKILSDDQSYLRPIYDSDWKYTYYRGWLNLPNKNLEARHKIFAFSLGGSENYDILGSLGYSPQTPPSAPMDNHHNINFLVYGFSVKSVKVFENQIALVGEPKQTGAQIVSIVQNDLLPQGVDTKDFLFQLSTSGGYEVDFIRHNIIRYEYLMQKIKENTVGAFDSLENENNSKEKLLIENEALKKELSYFIPLKDEIIYQKGCDSFSNSKSYSEDNQLAIKQGNKISFYYNYNNPNYKRPIYDPSWKVNYKRGWSYLPKQIEYNLHRLLVVPKSKKDQRDFFGILGFNEKFQTIKQESYGFVIYSFMVSDVKLYKNQLILMGTPSRSGAQIISVNHYSLKGFDKYKVSLVTPDNSNMDELEIDFKK